MRRRELERLGFRYSGMYTFLPRLMRYGLGALLRQRNREAAVTNAIARVMADNHELLARLEDEPRTTDA